MTCESRDHLLPAQVPGAFHGASSVIPRNRGTPEAPASSPSIPSPLTDAVPSQVVRLDQGRQVLLDSVPVRPGDLDDFSDRGPAAFGDGLKGIPSDRPGRAPSRNPVRVRSSLRRRRFCSRSARRNQPSHGCQSGAGVRNSFAASGAAPGSIRPCSLLDDSFQRGILADSVAPDLPPAPESVKQHP